MGIDRIKVFMTVIHVSLSASEPSSFHDESDRGSELLVVIEELPIAGEGQVQWGVQGLHGEGQPAGLPDEAADQGEVHLRREGDPRVHVHGVDHVLGDKHIDHILVIIIVKT